MRPAGQAVDPAKLARRRFRAREVTAAIQEELDASKKPTTFTVLSSRRVSNGRGVVVWELSLDQESDRFVLDEGMEGARAWWPEPVKGSAEVLTVNAEDGVISLTGCTCDPPGKDGTLKVYPKPFLEGLRDLWAHPEIGLAAAAWLARGRGGPSLGAPALDMRPFDAGTARTAQRAAADLLGHRVGYLWGPPGTGKTTTVGMLLAALLLAPGDARVLLLSTTNAAVDQALEAVDKSLERVARTDHRARLVRLSACHRFGRRFLAEVYRDRGHLLPTPDQELLNQLLEHEAHKPRNEDTVGLVEWNTRRDALRDSIAASRRAVLLSSRLVAMTSTGATFSHATLKEAGPFDWVVFDEGSQVSAAHFAALATLGHRVLVAGDPQQLGPVVLSKGEGPARWLSRSPFDLRDPAATAGMVFLDQQSRMAEGVCELVSNAFYRGKLKLAEDATPPLRTGSGGCDARYIRCRRSGAGA